MKKLLVLLSIISMAFILSLSASAAEERVVIDNVVYELMTDKYLYRFDNPYGEHYAVTDFLEDEALAETTTKITIVDEIDGIKVLGINTNEFAGDDGSAGYYEQEYSAVKEVILPETIKYMGEYAFMFFPSVEKLILPDGLEFFMEGTFYYMESLKSITIPEKITYIPDRAFERCGNLKKVVLQGNVTYIGERAFSDCEKLASFDFPETLKRIDERAFYGTALKKIVLPADVITYVSFSCCTKLKNVVYISDEPVEQVYLDDFGGCDNLKNIYIRAIATKRIIDGYYGETFSQIRLQHVYFEGSEALWKKLVTKEDRDKIAANDIHTGFYYKHEHNYSVDGAPTCKKGGTFNCKCICGDSYKVTLPKDPNNHKFGAWKVTKEASCAVTGLKKRICKTCGYVQQTKIRKEYLGRARVSADVLKTTTSKIVIKWEKAENATGYTIYETNKKHTKHTKIATVKADQTTYTFENLQSGKYYRYAVEAFNVDKNGNKAVSEKSYVTETTYPTHPPKNVKAVSNEPGIIEVTWDSNGPDVYYDTYCGTSEEAVRKCYYGSSLSRSYYSSTNKETIKKLKSGVTYYIMVTCFGENGVTLKSEVISIVAK